MRQSSTVEPLTSVSQALPMGLQQALAHLDMQIEEELARYRRQRHQLTGTPRSSAPLTPARPAAAKTLSLIAIPALGGRTNPLPQAVEVAAEFDEGAAASLAVASALVEPVEDDRLAGAITTSVYSDGQQPDATALDATDPERTHLDDYLESSEALLQSLAAEEAQVRAEKGFIKSLVTPLGIGSMLLLLLSSSLFGYVLMNPGNLTELLAFGRGPQTQPAVGNAPPPTSGESALSPLEPNLAAQEFKDLNINTLGSLKLHGNALKSPALPSPIATPTGKPVTVVGRVGTTGKVAPVLGSSPGGAAPVFGPAIVVPPRSRSTYTPPAPAVSVYSPPPAYRQAPAPRPAAAPVAPPRPTVTLQKPGSELAPAPRPSLSPSTASEPRRTVVVPYTNDRDLDAAQQVDPSAHMDSSFNDGITRINAGSYGDEATAKARVEALQRQGVKAEIREER